MKMSAKANFKKFGVGGYDLSNTKIAALMRGGAGKVSFVADNDILQGQGNIDAQFTKKIRFCGCIGGYIHDNLYIGVMWW